MSSAGYEPPIPEIRRLQTFALDRTATTILSLILQSCLFLVCHVDILQIQYNAVYLLRVSRAQTMYPSRFIILNCGKRPVYFTHFIFMRYPTPYISPFLGAIKLLSEAFTAVYILSKKTNSNFSRINNVGGRNADVHRMTAACWELHGMMKGFLGVIAKLRKGTVNFVVSVCPSAWNNWARTGRTFMKFDI